MIKLKNLHKQNLTEALGAGGPMYSDIVGNYGSFRTIEIKSSSDGSTTFEAGQSKINPNAPSIIKIVKQIRQLIKEKSIIEVVVNASASSLGQKTGFNNQALAVKRRQAMIDFLTEEFGTAFEIVQGTATVSKKEYPTPGGYEEDQNISVVINYYTEAQIMQHAEIDNTDTFRPNYYKNGGDGELDDIQQYIDIKRICVQIPETYVDEYTEVIKKFRQDHKLPNIPWAVYDTAKKIKAPGYKLTNDWGLDKKTKNPGYKLTNDWGLDTDYFSKVKK